MTSKRCLRQNEWLALMQDFGGGFLDMGVSNKNRTPYAKYMTPQNRDEILHNTVQVQNML